jgi:AraC-like DNA-binding protein
VAAPPPAEACENLPKEISEIVLETPTSKRIDLVKTNYFLTGANPPEALNLAELAARARAKDYQPRRLARELGLTNRTFERRFRRVFGCSPGQWLMEQRLQDGVALLERGLSTKQVAAELGFRDRSSLFRVFRLRLNDSPKRFANDSSRALAAAHRPQLSQSATFLSQSATPPGLRLTASL